MYKSTNVFVKRNHLHFLSVEVLIQVVLSKSSYIKGLGYFFVIVAKYGEIVDQKWPPGQKFETLGLVTFSLLIHLCKLDCSL